MAFPDSIDSFPTRVDGTVHWAEDQNALQSAIIAIERYIGTKTDSRVIINPEGGTMPPPTWASDGLMIGSYASGTIKALLHWLPLITTECTGYIIQRAITSLSATQTPTVFDTIATVSGRDNTSYTDSAGLKLGFKYWYRLAAQNIKGENGYWSTVLNKSATGDVTIGNPAAPSNLYIYVDGQGNLFGGWKYQAPDMNSNWYLGAEVVVNTDSNPMNGPLRGNGFAAYPTDVYDLTSLWQANRSQININTILYFHVKTKNQWGLESAYVTYGPFSVGQFIAQGFTTYQWSAYSNFKTLIESHFYGSDGGTMTYDPGTFIGEGAGLQYIGEMIAAGSIQTQALAVGSGNRNFDILGIEFHQNEYYDNTGLKTVNSNNWLRVTTTSSNPMIALVTDPRKEASGTITFWIINGFNGTAFLPGPDQVGVSKQFAPRLSTQLPYYVYVKCNKQSNQDAQIFVTADKYTPDGVGYYYYLIGMFDARSNRPAELALSYGFTFIDGNHITTGTIDCNKVNVHAAGSDVTIDGTGINIINGKMKFSSSASSLDPTNNLIINREGISSTAGDTSFSLNTTTGLEMKFGPNNLITLNRDGMAINSNAGDKLLITSSTISMTGGNGTVTLNQDGLTGNKFKLDNNGLLLTGGSIQMGGITLDSGGMRGSNFNITNGSISITPTGGGSTAAEPVSYNGVNLDSTGMWVGASGIKQCQVGLLGGTTYGFLAGQNYSSGPRAILDINGLKCYGKDGNIMFDTAGTDPNNPGNTSMLNAKYVAVACSAAVTWTNVPNGLQSKTYTLTLTGYGPKGSYGYNWWMLFPYIYAPNMNVTFGPTMSYVGAADPSSTNITIQVPVSMYGNGYEDFYAVFYIWLYKADVPFLANLANAITVT